MQAEIKDRRIPFPDDGVPFQRMNMARLVNIFVDGDEAAADGDYWSSDSAPQGGSSCASDSDSDFESGKAARIQARKNGPACHRLEDRRSQFGGRPLRAGLPVSVIHATPSPEIGAHFPSRDACMLFAAELFEANGRFVRFP